MSEVKRWKLKGFIPGIEGESKAVFQPTVVLAEDYDAALAREAALREELRLAKGLQTTTDAIVMLVDGQRDHWIEKCRSMKQRLAGAEQRVGELEGLLRDAMHSLDEEGYNTDPIYTALNAGSTPAELM